MNKTSAKDAMRELSMVLIYLSRFARENDLRMLRIFVRGRVIILMF